MTFEVSTSIISVDNEATWKASSSKSLIKVHCAIWITNWILEIHSWPVGDVNLSENKFHLQLSSLYETYFNRLPITSWVGASKIFFIRCDSMRNPQNGVHYVSLHKTSLRLSRSKIYMVVIRNDRWNSLSYLSCKTNRQSGHVREAAHSYTLSSLPPRAKVLTYDLAQIFMGLLMVILDDLDTNLELWTAR